ncbi:unnamed protein product [Spirodela intermedia]|uniref:Uncharacterized protein n=1 Tax=Spirodela intermedia TaxID=51605 RepID=A0ABN7ECG6_SPIIN|nr:unnamed protein product [Spirodela intermedia]
MSWRARGTPRSARGSSGRPAPPSAQACSRRSTARTPASSPCRLPPPSAPRWPPPILQAPPTPPPS